MSVGRSFGIETTTLKITNKKKYNIYHLFVSPFGIFVQFAKKVMALEVTPLRHGFWDQLDFGILLEKLQHSGFSSTNVALNRHNKRRVIRGHHFCRTDGGVSGVYEVRHGWFLFLNTKIFN